LFPPLTLPAFDCKRTEIDGKPHVWCLLRRRYLVLTPEEWVRQHVISLLVTQYAYPNALMRIEGGLRVNAQARRTDLVVYDRAGVPFLLVECKAPDVKLNQAVLEQAARYNQTLRARYLLLSNGLTHFCFAWTGERFEQQSGVPVYP
jgi:hypothetical protein